MLSDIGSWASILSLPITIWVLIETFRIKQHFSARARIPEIRKALAETSLAYLGNIRNNKDLNSAYSDLAKVLALLKNLQTRPVTKNLSSLNGVINRISHISTMRITDQNELWSAYTSIIEITTSLEQIERDMSWN